MGTNSGQLDEINWDDSVTEDCYNTRSDWSCVAGVMPVQSSSPYDVIESGEDKMWRFDMHFSELPEDLIPAYECSTLDDSPSLRPSPDNIRWEVNIADSEYHNDLYFEHPNPQTGDSDSSNEEYELVLEIIDGSGTYRSIGAAVGRYLINNDNVYVSVADDDSGVTWDIDLTGDYGDLPQEDGGEVNAVQVSARVNNNYDSGSHYVKYVPEYTISIPRVDQLYCQCEAYYLYHTTMPGVIGFASFEAQP